MAQKIEMFRIAMQDVQRLPEGCRANLLNFARDNGGSVTVKRVAMPWDRDQMVRLMGERAGWVSELFRHRVLTPYRNRMHFGSDAHPASPLLFDGLDLLQCTFTNEHLRLRHGVVSDVNFNLTHVDLQCADIRDCTLTDSAKMVAVASSIDGLTATQAVLQVLWAACIFRRVDLSACRVDGEISACTFEGCQFYKLREFQGPLRFENCRFDTCRFYGVSNLVEFRNCTFHRCRGFIERPGARKVVASGDAAGPADDRSASDSPPGSGDVSGGFNPADTPDPGGSFCFD